MAKCRVCGQEVQGSFDAHLQDAHGGDPKIGLDGQGGSGTLSFIKGLMGLFSFGSKGEGPPSSGSGA